MDIKVINSQGQVETPTEVGKESETTPLLTGDLLYQSVGQIFDFKPSEVGQYREKLGTLIAYARTQTDDVSSEGLKWAIRALQNKVGTPPLGEKWVNWLSKYAYIKLEGLKLKQEADKYERNP